jgi:hypothetical protein
MTLNEFENKIQLEKKIKIQTSIKRMMTKFNIKIKWNQIMKGEIKEKTNNFFKKKTAQKNED